MLLGHTDPTDARTSAFTVWIWKGDCLIALTLMLAAGTGKAAT